VEILRYNAWRGSRTTRVSWQPRELHAAGDAAHSCLVRQFKAGVEAVQIFDTWAGILPAREFEMWCKIAAELRAGSARKTSGVRVVHGGVWYVRPEGGEGALEESAA
jgi:Uroporphyrinogen decarboxylase (URO-D)